MAEANPILQYVQEKLGSKVLALLDSQGDNVVILSGEGLRESFRLFKEDLKLGFDLLSDITAVDYWQKKEPRFEVVYQLAKLTGGHRLRVRVPVAESDAAVQSLTPLWRGANFLEREVWDLFGIRFIDHPDLRRILLYEEFQGYPLRKDYPINLCQPRVPERHVDGTFVDERSYNKLRQLTHEIDRKKR